MLQVALWTLGQVIESTAYVIEPYQKYPMLLDVLLSFLKTEQTANIRREVSVPLSRSLLNVLFTCDVANEQLPLQTQYVIGCLEGKIIPHITRISFSFFAA